MTSSTEEENLLPYAVSETISSIALKNWDNGGWWDELAMTVREAVLPVRRDHLGPVHDEITNMDLHRLARHEHAERLAR